MVSLSISTVVLKVYHVSQIASHSLVE